MGSNGGNVVPLSRARTPRLSPQESASVLKGCRELALERMASALAGMLDRVEDELFDLAEKSVTDRDAQNLYLDARTQARANRTAIESAFRAHFVECFNSKVLGESAVAQREEGELELVDDAALEERLAMEEMSRQMGSSCEKELFALSQRMGFLLERPDLEDDANPVSPATICAALKDACDQIQSDYRVRMALLRQLVRHTEGELQRVYHDLNALLVERRILPDVRPTARRNPSATAVPKREANVPASVRQAAAKTPDLFATLSQLVATAPVGVGVNPGPAPAPALVAELTRLHREAPPPGAERVNVLREIKAAPREVPLSGLDASTIDLVAMLFDFVFDDDSIPAAVKARLGRLQIPVLKVAILDRTFFSSSAHPARRLIDLLAQASIGAHGHDADDAALTLVDSVVDTVLADFETDLELFEKQVARVNAFIVQQGRAEAEVVERSARLIEAREREEIARAVGEEEVARRLQVRIWAPAPVRDMLVGPWVRALGAVHLAEGEGSPAWQALLHTMDDLLWSVEPKASPDERKRLVSMLPGMLRRLHDGFARASISETERDVFFGSLVDCHAQAVKAGLRGLAAIPQPAAPAPANEDPRIEREIVPAAGIRVEEIRLRATQNGVVRNVFTRSGIWTNLQRGTWVEFRDDLGVVSRARLTWVSPNKGVYLFTNPAAGLSALSISPDALAEQMRRGEARVLDAAPLVERAVGSMLEGLRPGR